MKRCPKCNAEYFDNMLEFCLEDGTRLTAAAQAQTAAYTRSHPLSTLPHSTPMTTAASEETVVMSGKSDTSVAAGSMPAETASWMSKVLETTPIVIALAHNWWQWLYLEKQYASSITDYVLSANFLMWILLLAGGGALSLYSVKNSKNKTLAIVSLVVLAVNLILFLVPRR